MLVKQLLTAFLQTFRWKLLPFVCKRQTTAGKIIANIIISLLKVDEVIHLVVGIDKTIIVGFRMNPIPSYGRDRMRI